MAHRSNPVVIAYVMVPHFVSAIERRRNPKLKGSPLIILQPGQRGKVYALSPEAAKAGVREGMPLPAAEALCPGAAFIPAAQSRYRRACEALLGVLEVFGPVEADGEGCAYLDLGSCDAEEVVQRLGQAVRREAGLPPAIGVAGGKFAARLAASLVEPGKALIIPRGRGREFLALFPVETLPAGEETVRRLRLLGISTLSQVAALPPGAVLAQFGREGQRLQRLALGRDDRRVVPRRRKAAQKRERYFDDPVEDVLILKGIAQATSEELLRELKSGHRMCRELGVWVHFEDGTVQEESLVFSQPTASPRKIAFNLSQLLGRVEYRCGVVGLELVLGDIVPERGRQLSLFHRAEGELAGLLEGPRRRYGCGCFYRASLVDREARLPERRFILLEVGAE